MDYKELCEKVCAVAQQAGGYIARQREDFSFDRIEFKGAHDMVSYVDREAERMIVAALREMTPDAGFITEEGTAGAQGERRKWVIDPLDGTTNFVHGVPPYCVSIALMEEERLVVGVIYEVTLGELFYAYEGGSGAFLNGRPIRVSAIGKMEHALVAVGFAHGTRYHDHITAFLKEMGFYQSHTDGVRRLGSAAIHLAYVACGRFDVFSQVRLSPWDVAAGALIAQKAGAVVTDCAGGGNFLFGGEILAANPVIHGEFLRTVQALQQP